MKYLIGNWKSNLKYQDLKPYFSEFNGMLSNREIDFKLMLAMPDMWLSTAKDLAYKKVECCSQNIDQPIMGSFTGSNNVLMVKSIVNYTLLNHSEARKYSSDNNTKVNLKLKTSLENDLRVVLCVGEPIEIHEKKQTIDFLKKQLEEILNGIDNANEQNLIIAYEPLWAIGTGLTPNNEEIFHVVEQLKRYLFDIYGINFDFLYGGSVSRKNIKTLMEIENLSGFLVGNLSLRVDKFFEIVNYFNYNK